METRKIEASCSICKTKASIEVSPRSYDKWHSESPEITAECFNKMNEIENKEILINGFCSNCNSYSKRKKNHE